MTSALPGTAAKPARTELDRVVPPPTIVSAPDAGPPAWSGGTTTTTPSSAPAAVARAAASDQSRTGRPASSSYCLGRPNRLPDPAATTITHTDGMTGAEATGRRIGRRVAA